MKEKTFLQGGKNLIFHSDKYTSFSYTYTLLMSKSALIIANVNL
jgi:hypothetical protein